MNESAAPNAERAVLKVLTGALLNDAATAEQIASADLAEAVEIYRQAGRRALDQQAASGWWQLYIQFTDWATAEQAAADNLTPLLDRAEQDGLVTRWWFMRKHPCWRLRLQPGPDGHLLREHLRSALDELAADNRITAWWPGLYEAETAAFGGTTGMDAAHDLFCADSRAILNLVRNGGVGLGRRELSLMLCSILLRAAGLEWYEQGDVWHRVTLERPLPDDIPASKLTAMASDLTHLMLADATPDGPLLRADGPLASTADWANAFRQGGRALGAAARAGTLQRGLREVLSYLVIFHWNRLGLPTRTQSILASAARAVVLGPPAHGTGNRVADGRIPDTAQPVPSPPTVGAAAERALARFPLVSQRRFRCPDLKTHIRSVRETANSCHEPTNTEDRINRACTVWNLSALIAADCGMPALATDLCRRQFQIFQAAAPISGRTAIAALQPLVNLARLTRRAGDPEAAYRELEAINHAVHHGGEAVIHGQSFQLGRLIADDRSTVDGWLQAILREDGIRALAAAGLWDKAAAHAAQYDNATDQLREAHQARAIAHALNGDIEPALSLVNNGARNQAWEHAVAACLRNYIFLTAERLTAADVTQMLNATRVALESTDRPTTLFRVRLGLAAADLAAGARQEGADVLFRELLEVAERSADAFVAREVLADPECRKQARPDQAEALALLVEQAGLGAGQIQEPLLNDIMTSVQTAEAVLTETLGVSSNR